MLTTTKQDREIRARIELAHKITQAFPNLEEHREDLFNGAEINLSQMETSADPINGFNDEQRRAYLAVLIHKMWPLLKKLDRAVSRWPGHLSSLAHMMELTLVAMEAANPGPIQIKLQCERIEALARELDIARSKGDLSNEELRKAAGTKDLDKQYGALVDELNESEKTDEELAALSNKIGAVIEQIDQKLAKFLFEPPTAANSGETDAGLQKVLEDNMVT
jgi:hypothetical protein